MITRRERKSIKRKRSRTQDYQEGEEKQEEKEEQKTGGSEGRGKAGRERGPEYRIIRWERKSREKKRSRIQHYQIEEEKQGDKEE